LVDTTYQSNLESIFFRGKFRIKLINEKVKIWN